MPVTSNFVFKSKLTLTHTHACRSAVSRTWSEMFTAVVPAHGSLSVSSHVGIMLRAQEVMKENMAVSPRLEGRPADACTLA